MRVPTPGYGPRGCSQGVRLRWVAHYCRAGCESSRPFGFQGTPPRDLGGVFAFWPAFRRDRESHPSWARSLPLGTSITGSCPLGPHGRDFGPKSLRVSRRRLPGLTGVRARESATDEITSVPRRARVGPPTTTRRFTGGQMARRLHREPLPERMLRRLAGAPDANPEPRDHDARGARRRSREHPRARPRTGHPCGTFAFHPGAKRPGEI